MHKRHKFAGPLKLAQMKRDYQIEFLKNIGLKRYHTLLDYGCGTLRGGIPIIQYLYDYNYIGVDIRSDVLLEAYAEIEENNLYDKHPRLRLCNDFNLGRGFEDIRFNFIWCFSTLIHMDDNIADGFFAFVYNVLEYDGVCYANANITERKDGSWQGFPVKFKTYDFYWNLAEKNNLKISNCGRLKDLGHVSGNKAGDNQIMLRVTK